jgi:hypothetical protein
LQAFYILRECRGQFMCGANLRVRTVARAFQVMCGQRTLPARATRSSVRNFPTASGRIRGDRLCAAAALSLAFASWEVGMRERERVWWNDGFVRRTEGDELFGFGVHRVCRIAQRKIGTSQRLPGHGRCTFGKSYLISDAATLDSTMLMFVHFCVPRGPLDPAHDLMVVVGTILRRGKCSKR